MCRRCQEKKFFRWSATYFISSNSKRIFNDTIFANRSIMPILKWFFLYKNLKGYQYSNLSLEDRIRHDGNIHSSNIFSLLQIIPKSLRENNNKKIIYIDQTLKQLFHGYDRDLWANRKI